MRIQLKRGELFYRGLRTIINIKKSDRQVRDVRKRFNVTGVCRPGLHYMVDIGNRLIEIKEMVDRGDYFTINRARQYGKTTTLKALADFLEKDYMVISLDFQILGASKFRNENIFSLAFANLFVRAMESVQKHSAATQAVCALKQALQENREELELFELFEYLSGICSKAEKPVVLLIDEVDSASNNQVFLDFLAQLRGYYIDRDVKATFHSVILAGVYDIKNIKRKIRSEEEHKFNSPWNIAVDFPVDMSFSAADIAGMLKQYEADCKVGMDVGEIAGMIYDYTSGYPFLVSYLCKLIDEKVTSNHTENVWTREGVLAAVRIMLSESNTLFESLFNKLEDYPELRRMLGELLLRGKEIPYVVGMRSIETALMFGFVKKADHNVVIANRIFEVLLYNLFLASTDMQEEPIYNEALRDKNQFICDGRLDMRLVLEKFVMHFDEIYGDRQQTFIEEEGRRYFLLYLRPIINGAGNYYVESRTRNMERTDVIVDYCGEQFVIELKVWRGNAYHERGEEQLAAYLEYYHLERGYMLSFNFNKKKEIGVKELRIGKKMLVEAVV